jgi:hypothetical protein
MQGWLWSGAVSHYIFCLDNHNQLLEQRGRRLTTIIEVDSSLEETCHNRILVGKIVIDKLWGQGRSGIVNQNCERAVHDLT